MFEVSKWQIPKSVADSPILSCLPFPPTFSLQLLLRLSFKNLPQMPQQERKYSPAWHWEWAILPSLENSGSPLWPPLPCTVTLRRWENWKSYFFTPCRKYDINYQFGENVNWDEMAGSGGQIWKWSKNYHKLQTEIVLKNVVPKYKKGWALLILVFCNNFYFVCLFVFRPLPPQPSRNQFTFASNVLFALSETANTHLMPSNNATDQCSMI